MYYTEIQECRQNWQENEFWEKSPDDSADCMGSKISPISLISPCFRDKGVFAFYTEIQDGRQKRRENDFCKTITVSEINAILCFMQKFKMATKNWWGKLAS